MTAASRCLGIDGCPAGWVAVSQRGAWVDDDLRRLLEYLAPDVVALDMPIGLPTNTPRECDRAARRLLGAGRGASVFPAPMRATLAATTHAQASELNAAACGKRLSIQAYNLLPKIREVDTLLQGSVHWRARLFETHPEVSFAAMNDGRPIIQPKRKAPGRSLRQQLTGRYFGVGAFVGARAAIARGDAADDDIADAFACLFTAQRIARGDHVTLPSPTRLDASGLAMRICF